VKQKHLVSLFIAASLSSFHVVAQDVIESMDEESVRVTAPSARDIEGFDPEQDVEIDDSKPALREAEAFYISPDRQDGGSLDVIEKIIKIDTPRNEDALYDMTEIDNKAVNPTIQPTNTKETFNSQPSGNITVYDPKLAAYQKKKKKKPFENQAPIADVTKPFIETQIVLQNNETLAAPKPVEDNIKKLTVQRVQ
jgi:hypothetical protein